MLLARVGGGLCTFVCGGLTHTRRLGGTQGWPPPTLRVVRPSGPPAATESLFLLRWFAIWRQNKGLWRVKMPQNEL